MTNGWVGELQLGIYKGIANITLAIPSRLSAKGMPGVCSAGRVSGQATQPGSTHTSSPSVQWAVFTPSHWGRRKASAQT